MNEITQLVNDGILSKEQSDTIHTYEKEKPFSVHWELRTILYLGILLLASGTGILIYQNIDTIGHQAILLVILSVCIGCLYYGYKKRLPYSHQETKHPSPFFDYVVLLGCLLFGIFIGYAQFQYNAFGLHYGIAVLLPTLLFFLCGYLFDHKGILCMGITGLAAWAGLTVTPLDLLEKNDFYDTSIIFSSIFLGVSIAGFSKYTDVKKIKEHFGFSYNNFAANILFIATLAALFNKPFKMLSFLSLAVICFYYIRYAIVQKSFLFLLLSVLYGYIGLTYCIFKAFISFENETSVYLSMLYLMASCAGVIKFFMSYKKILGIN